MSLPLALLLDSGVRRNDESESASMYLIVAIDQQCLAGNTSK
ncbi:hypothetical protein [Deefgea tanakiae]|nr:hypothetical protein [Deefgea tanakiae]